MSCRHQQCTLHGPPDDLLIESWDSISGTGRHKSTLHESLNQTWRERKGESFASRKEGGGRTLHHLLYCCTVSTARDLYQRGDKCGTLLLTVETMLLVSHNGFCKCGWLARLKQCHKEGIAYAHLDSRVSRGMSECLCSNHMLCRGIPVNS